MEQGRISLRTGARRRRRRHRWPGPAVRAIVDLGVTAYTGLPSYLKALVERFDEAGEDPGAWRLERALVTAEPLPDSLRETLTRRVPHVRMAYGTGETGLLAWEPAGEEPGHGLVLADGVDVKVCAIGTGEPLTDGTEGEVVISLLREDYPLLRFGTGELSAWVLGPDGSLRLAGVLGRVGQAVKVKGMFLHPRQVAGVMAGAPGVADYRFVIDREDHVDRLTCRVVPDGSVPTSSWPTRSPPGCGRACASAPTSRSSGARGVSGTARASWSTSGTGPEGGLGGRACLAVSDPDELGVSQG